MEADMANAPTTHDNGAVPLKRARLDLKGTSDQQMRRLRKEGYRKAPIHGVKDRKVRANLKSLQTKYKDSATQARNAEILHEVQGGLLEPENDMEKTYKISQDEILAGIPIEAAKKGKFQVNLGFGPYVFDYTRNGRELLLAGRKGHVATMDWREGKLGCELQLGETVRDAKWLHNNQMFAVAQKKYTYIYDRAGVEIHCLKKHIEVTNMEFLPYHYLLATIGNAGYLKYQDVSTGNLVTEMPTKLGSPTALTQNPRNAVLHMGHQNGTVTLWSPNSTTPLAKINAHRGPVRALGVDREGRYMVSAGQDCKMAVWDIRMFKEVSNYFTRTPASSVAISDRNLTAIGWGTQTSIWRDLFSTEKVQSPYMSWGGEGKRVERVRWCPFEDSLGVGHDAGFSTVVVPGAGEPNFDAREINPYENTKQRQETEVRTLLNKLQPEMISLDADYVGNVNIRTFEEQQAAKDNDPKPVVDPIADLKNRGRGKNSSLRKHLRKKGGRNIVDEKRKRLEEALEEQKKDGAKRLTESQQELGPALGRFAQKKSIF